jgi:hypothetical protein
MSSNSVRIEAELFEAARTDGALMSRSAAQQIEHWARMGAALESCGLTVGQVASLLRVRSDEGHRGDAELWHFKRQRQKADMDSAREGRATQDQLSWFSGGKARHLKIIGAPY